MPIFDSPYKYLLSVATLIAIHIGFVVTPLASEEQNVNPAINEYYYDTEYEHWVSVFERPGREVYDKREAVVAALRLKVGMTVADLGAGTGLYTFLFAKEVGNSGRIYAVDISKNFIEHIKHEARSRGLHNIEGIVNTQQSTQLPVEAVDVVFVCDTYHHFEYPQAMLTSIHQALRQNGQLIIIDFRKQPGLSSDWVMSHVRADETVVISEVETTGFKLIEQAKLLHDNYFLKFVKVDD